MKTKYNFKLNDNVEFLEHPIKNWRYGKIIEIGSVSGKYKIYSGMEVFWAKEVESKRGIHLESI